MPRRPDQQRKFHRQMHVRAVRLRNSSSKSMPLRVCRTSRSLALVRVRERPLEKLPIRSAEGDLRATIRDLLEAPVDDHIAACPSRAIPPQRHGR